MTIVEEFLLKWREYFGDADLPLAFYYDDSPQNAEYAGIPGNHRCVICELAKVRRGASLYFDINSVGCGGGRRYFGFTKELRANFKYFLSCGLEGEIEGERYKKTPELVVEHLKQQKIFTAPAKNIVFKRIDKLDEKDEPLVVIFFAKPDTLAGLFTLANFDQAERNGVVAPFGSGCSSIVQDPYQELIAGSDRAVLGMFDVSARPCVPADVLTLSVNWPKFEGMVGNMDESFLITESWKKVKKRIAKSE
jgi:uncharacterized protein (DUF169 family)